MCGERERERKKKERERESREGGKEGERESARARARKREAYAHVGKHVLILQACVRQRASVSQPHKVPSKLRTLSSLAHWPLSLSHLLRSKVVVLHDPEAN